MISLFFLCAHADESLPELWTLLHEGELLHMIDGDPKGAIEIFQALQEGVSSTHPLYGRMLFALGRAYYDVGNKKKAKSDILESIRSVYPPEEAVTYYVDMLAKERPIQTLPYQGEPWFSLSDTDALPKRYKVHLSDRASSFSEAQLQINMQEGAQLYLSIFDVAGVEITEKVSLSEGNHSLVIKREVFPKTLKENKEIVGIEIVTQREGVLSLSQLALR